MSRQSNMTPDEFRLILTTVYGERAQRRLGQDIGRGEVTISRWLSGASPIGDVEAILLRLIFMLHKQKIAWRALMQEYEGVAGIKKPTMEDLL